MRIFQFHTFYLPYLKDFNNRYPEAKNISYNKRLEWILHDRFMATHILQPIYNHSSDVIFSITNDPCLQLQWAREHQINGTDYKKILLAQIEEHKTDIIYSLSPILFDSKFLRSLPGCVKLKLCWLAAPIYDADLSAYDAVMCNFPTIQKSWQEKGLHTKWFSPSYDPVMGLYTSEEDRPIDISFVGQYSNLHKNRNELLNVVASLSNQYSISFRLMCPKQKRLAEYRYLNRIPLPIPYLPENLRSISGPSVFGRNMYEVFGSSKVVINAAIDMGGRDRGNMRCFEALGCGAAMLSDEGNYPDGLTPQKHFETYSNMSDLLLKIKQLLVSKDYRENLANAGNQYIKSNFSKENQWESFIKIVGSL